MIRIATLNLYHWAEPGIWWYARTEGRHDAESWSRKRAWLAALLVEMDADLVGFQEVVSVEALRELCAEAGYPHFAVGDAPVIEEGEIYTRPVQTLASRHPMTAEALRAPEGFPAALSLPEDWSIRRPAVKAAVDLPGLGAALIYVCHLKSKGAAPRALRFAPETPWDERVRETLAAISRGHASATRQRTAEASALYHEAVARIAENPARPVIVMGDLNDDPFTPALEALTASRPPGEVDGFAFEDLPDEARALVARYQLHDAWRLCRRDPRDEGRGTGPGRDWTHAQGSARSVLDFILVSEALNPLAAGRTGAVLGHHVFDAHLWRGDADGSSDHAAVLVEIGAA